jgi:2-polyprenyl-6-hydroxyphenyl methylase/3-demethylubiquinone-9 3-methyltransferase
MKNPDNSDDKEIRKFDSISKFWWDPEGIMGTLHTINPLRVKFIQEYPNLPNSRVLDVGCGGGILSEALARAGAIVMGIDLSEASLQVARQHAQERGLKITYQHKSLEEVANKEWENFDVVTCMEMLEHVPDPARIVQACARVLKPGGHFFCSTINRTLKAFLYAIIGGEYILHLLPKGSHGYSKLIRPHELKRWARESGLEFVSLSSLMYNPLTRRFSLAEGKADVDYMAHFIKKNSNMESVK